MIPSMGDIINGLLSGEFTAVQANRWIGIHLQLNRESSLQQAFDIVASSPSIETACQAIIAAMAINAASGGK